MQKQTNNTTTQQPLTPTLRFPQFTEQWKTKKLGEVAESIYSGKSKATNKSGKFAFYGSTGIIAYSDNFDYSGDKIIVARVGANAGSLYKVYGNYSVSDNALMITVSKEANIDFVAITLLNMNLSRITFGSGQPLITGGQLKQIPISLPSLPEQQKITDFLSAVDEKTQTLKKKKHLLEQYKKGIMQQIFTQTLRFKDEQGNDFPEWEERKLGKIAHVTTGRLDANAMTTNGQYPFYTCAKEHYWIDNYAFDTEALLISGNGAYVGYVHYYKGKFNAYQRTYVLLNFQSNAIYTKYYLDMFLRQRIASEKKEGNTPYITLSTLTEMPIRLPSLPEQQKIVTFLSALDEKINYAQEEITKIALWKKGLLQQLFPQ